MTEEPNLSAESLAILSDWLTEGPIGLPKPEQDLMEALALKKLLDEHSASVSQGYHLVMNEINSDPSMKDRINDFRIDIKIIRQMRHPSEASQLLKEHGVLQGVLGVSGQAMGTMVQIAQNFFEQKKYEQTSWVLQYLLFLNPYICWLWQQLAHCCQAQNRWDEAEWALEWH